ncbi:MAG: VWA domain-containing protein [Spirochaetaceae bacterium]|jgi:Ca-activated chloride channel family protein|nr:VWA domain-containing protein [Spirochaetaceae bacterium]
MNTFLIQYFEKPYMLKLLVCIPCIICILIYHFYRRYPVIKKMLLRKGALINTGGAAGPPALPPRYVFSALFFVVFVFCAILALASPRMGKRHIREFRRGADIVLAYDVSQSMNARDAGRRGGDGLQSPLERALYLGGELVLSSLEDGAARGREVVMPADIHIRFALASGKGRAYLAVPLTSDAEAVLSMLSALSSGVISARGTNLENLLDAASRAFTGNFATEKIIILFSDGEALGGSLQQAAERTKNDGIVLYTVGLGSAEGTPLDMEGTEPVTSFLHSETLSQAALISGGRYIDGNGRSAREQLVRIAGESGKASWNYREEAVPVWHIFLMAALAALLVSRLCGKRIRMRGTGVGVAPLA